MVERGRNFKCNFYRTLLYRIDVIIPFNLLARRKRFERNVKFVLTDGKNFTMKINRKFGLFEISSGRGHAIIIPRVVLTKYKRVTS